mgnify:CR=1 FL=1
MLLAVILLSSSIGIVSGQVQPTDLYTPVGIYEVSISAPNSVDFGKVFDVAVTVTVTGINESSAWYNLTMAEGIESIFVSFVEAGITLEKRPCVTMITNSNVSLTVEASPIYAINVTSLKQVFTLNSSFLGLGNYSMYVSVKGFRWAAVGLAIGTSSFYLEDEATVSITGTTALEGAVYELLTETGELSSTIDDLRRELSTVTMVLYSAIAIAAVGVIVGIAGIFLARRKS